MILRERAKKIFKTASCVLKVEGQVAYIVPRCLLAGGSTAGKQRLGFPRAGFQHMMLEKRYRHKGNIQQLPDLTTVNLQMLKEGSVNGVMMRLKMKKLQGNFIEWQRVMRV